MSCLSENIQVLSFTDTVPQIFIHERIYSVFWMFILPAKAICRGELYLIIRGPESPSYILVVQNLHLKAEIFLHVLDDHDQEG